MYGFKTELAKDQEIVNSELKKYFKKIKIAKSEF